MSSNQPNYPQMPQSSECDELRDLLPAYLVGATSNEEGARVQELLVRCPEVAAEMPEYAALITNMAAEVEPIAPPASLKTSVLAAIAAEASAQPRQSEKIIHLPEDNASRKAFPQVGWWVAGIAIVLLIASNAIWAVQFNERSAQLQALRQEQDTLSTLLVSVDSHHVGIYSTQDNSPLGTVVWDPSTQVVTLYTRGLPALDSDHIYQLWLIGADGPLSAGIFDVDNHGSALHTFHAAADLQNYDAIGISVEPSAGSEQPTTDPLAVGTVEV